VHSVWHDIATAIQDGTFERPDPKLATGYCQGMSQVQRDRLDGYRDALRVLDGDIEPSDLNRAMQTVTAAYLEGVEQAKSERGLA
jgi:hypothetical protein